MTFFRESRFCFLFGVVAIAAVFAEGAHYDRITGTIDDGPHVALIVPLPPHPESIGIAAQLRTLPVERGALTIIETHGDPRAAQVAGNLGRAGASGDGRPDWLWVHKGARSADAFGEEISETTIRIEGDAFDSMGERLTDAMDGEAGIRSAVPDRLSGLAGEGVLTIDHPSRTPVSKQVRYTRQLLVALLRELDMIEPDTDFEWDRLTEFSGNLVAIYDAEGVGAAGAANLERIAAARLDDTAVYRVCGEDVREGALRPAAASIFPGGSGGGIGRGLEEAGREELRDYIASGGGFLGVCAGAYFAGSGLDNYLHAVELKHSQPWRRGRGFVDIELTPEGEELFGTENTVIRTRFANGPVFLAEDQDGDGDPQFVPLALFKTPSTDNDGVVREEMVGETAIGLREFGNGRILTISPHPESHAEHYDFVARALAWTMAID